MRQNNDYGIILKFLFTIILAFFECNRIGGAGFRTDRVAHIPTAITFDGDLDGRRRVNDPERADHYAHPTSNTSRFVDINQTGSRIFAHGSIGTRIQTRRCFTMPALQGEFLSFYIHPGHRLGIFNDRQRNLLAKRCDL